ncbi:MAG: hypothetical protein IPK03_00420 [Bacteroidetes bacterium]|nr:hypothetical protein [Bacteroidota bacterium]
MGQGEALDCYNRDLQSESIYAQQLRNQQLEQAIGIINGIADPIEKAVHYKEVFGQDCCKEDGEA